MLKVHNLELGGHPITVVEDPSMPENELRMMTNEKFKEIYGGAYFTLPTTQREIDAGKQALTPDELRQIYYGEPPCQ